MPKLFLPPGRKTRVLACSLIFVLLLYGGSVVFAQDDAAHPNWGEVLIGSDSAGILPTSQFYFLKEWGRGIRKIFTFGAEKKAELELRYADEKLVELKEVAASGKSADALKKALENYLEAKEALAERLAALDEQNPNVQKLLAKTAEKEILHQALFDELQNKSPEADDTLRAADVEKKVRSSISVIVLDRAGSEARQAFLDGVSRALDILPHEKGVKELKALEVLTKIEESLPQEDIQGADQRGIEKKDIRRGLVIAKEAIINKLTEEGTIEELLKSGPAAPEAATGAEPEPEMGKGIMKGQGGNTSSAKTAGTNLTIKTKSSPPRVEGGSEGEAEAITVFINGVPLEASALNKVLDELEAKAKEVNPVTQRPNIVNIEAVKELKEAVKEAKPIEIQPLPPSPIPGSSETLVPPPPATRDTLTPSKDETLLCTQEWNPVCGTNNKTYSNECMAKVAGVGVQHKGECTSSTKSTDGASSGALSPVAPTTQVTTQAGVVEYKVEADDYGFYPSSIAVPKGSKVKLYFIVRSTNVYYGGLDFRSDTFKTSTILPGGVGNVEFAADSSFVISSYWPLSGVKKAELKVEAK